MKVLKVLTLFLAIALPLSVFSQAKQDTAKINVIKKQFAYINGHISSYKKVHRNNMGQSTEGGAAMAYFDGSDLKKIVSTMYGETGKGIREYYFDNKKLIFCYDVIYRYNRPINVDGGGKIAHTYETRYYFDGDKILKYLKGQQKDPNAEPQDKDVKETLEEVERLVKLIHSKNEY
jgi:hypothetical protein